MSKSSHRRSPRHRVLIVLAAVIAIVLALRPRKVQSG